MARRTRRQRRAQRRTAKRDAALRAKANKLRVRAPVRERHFADKKHRNMMRAHASTGRRFPYDWSLNW